MIRPVSTPTVAFITCTCGHVLTVHDGVALCEHKVVVVDNGVEQTINQLIRHRVAVVTELVGGGAE